MAPQWAETDPQSLIKIQMTFIRASPPFWARVSSTALENED